MASVEHVGSSSDVSWSSERVHEPAGGGEAQGSINPEGLLDISQRASGRASVPGDAASATPSRHSRIATPRATRVRSKERVVEEAEEIDDRDGGSDGAEPEEVATRGATVPRLDFRDVIPIVREDDRFVLAARDRFVLPPYTIRVPGPHDRACHPGPNEVAVYTECFEHGLRFPMHPFLELVLNRLELPPWLVTPKSILNVMTFIILCQMNGFPPSLTLFRHLFSTTVSLEAYYVIGARRGKALTQKPKSKFDLWRYNFVFVRHPDGHGILTEMSELNESLNKKPKLTEVEEDMVQILLAKPLPLYHNVMTEQNVITYGWPLGEEMDADRARLAAEARAAVAAVVKKRTEVGGPSGPAKKARVTIRPTDPATETVVPGGGVQGEPTQERPAKRPGKEIPTAPPPVTTTGGKKDASAPVAPGPSGFLDVWPYGCHSIEPTGTPHESCSRSLAYFGKARSELPTDDAHLQKAPYLVGADESIFDEASVGARLAANSLLARDQQSLSFIDAERLINTLIWRTQQISAIAVALQPRGIIIDREDEVHRGHLLEMDRLRAEYEKARKTDKATMGKLKDELAVAKKFKAEAETAIVEARKEADAALSAERKKAQAVIKRTNDELTALRADIQRQREEAVEAYKQGVALPQMAEIGADYFLRGFDQCLSEVRRVFPKAAIDESLLSREMAMEEEEKTVS